MQDDKLQKEGPLNGRDLLREEASSTVHEEGEDSSSFEEFFEDVIFSREGDDEVKLVKDEVDKDLQDIYDFSDVNFEIIEPKRCSLLDLKVPRPPYLNPYTTRFTRAHEIHHLSSTSSTLGPIPPLMSLVVGPPMDYHYARKPISSICRLPSILSPRRSTISTYSHRHKDRRSSSRDRSRSSVSHRRR